MISACCVFDKIVCNLYGNVVLLLELRAVLVVVGELPNTIRLRLLLLFAMHVFVLLFTDTAAGCAGYRTMGVMTACFVVLEVLLFAWLLLPRNVC